MKVAVSIPDAIFEAAEKLARERNQPRSQFYAEAIESYVDTLGTERITARLDEIYKNQPASLDPALQEAQLRLIDDEAW